MPYRSVLELSVTHPAAAGGALPGAMVVPDAASLTRLAGLRLRAKPIGNRLVVLADLDDANKPRVPLRAPVALAFAVAPLPAVLAAATDLVALAEASSFTDARAGKGDPQPLRRIARTAPSNAAAVATVTLSLTPADLAAAIAGTVRRCTAALPGVAARWCYHVVTNLSVPIADWQIVRAAGVKGAGPAFAAAGRTELTAADATDAVGTALRVAHPGLRVIRFLSDTSFAIADEPVRGLELRAGATRLLAALPNPPPAAVRIGKAAAFAQTVRIVTA